MHVGDYILALVGIVLGLALADLAFSAHRLISRRSDVQFDAAPVLAAMIAAYLVFLNFWGDYSHYRAVTQASLWATLPNLALLFVNFLIAATALPDEWQGKIHLWDFYLRTRRQFWGLIALAGVLATIYNGAQNWPPPASEYVSGAMTLVLAALAFLTQRRWVHLLLLTIFLAVLVVGTRSFVISG